MKSAFSKTLGEIRSEVAGLPTDSKTLRRFGLLVGFVLIGLAAALAWKTGWDPGWKLGLLAGTGLLLCVFGLARPDALRGVYRIWMLAATLMGFVMTRVLLTMVFYLVVTPTGLIMRLFRRDPMNRHPDSSKDTYWLPRDPEANDRTRMERSF